MAGLINQQMTDAQPADPAAQPAPDGAPAPAPQDAAPPGQGGGQLTITPEMLLGKLHLDGNKKAQLQRIVVAGMKVMFDKKTHKLMLDSMQGEGDWPSKLGKSIAGLMGILFKESNNSLPPDLLIPAGMVLLAHAAQFVAETEGNITDEDVGNAIHIFAQVVMHMNGIDGDKVAEIGGRAPQPGAGAPAAPPPDASMPPPAGGVVGQAMGGA